MTGLDEALQSVLTTRSRGEVMSRLRPVVQRMLDEHAEAIAEAIEQTGELEFRKPGSILDDDYGKGIDRAAGVARGFKAGE